MKVTLILSALAAFAAAAPSSNLVARAGQITKEELDKLESLATKYAKPSILNWHFSPFIWVCSCLVAPHLTPILTFIS